MLEQLLLHIQRNQLCKTTDKILLAVSGGVDSMVMVRLFNEAGLTIGVAHCNFQLRGAESDGDEELVQNVCSKLKIPFHSQRFETSKFASETGLSLQLAARKLRYDFFEKIRADYGYQYVATAHHRNDSFETVLLNLTKGTGLKGLAGISVRTNFVIRPMLFASRDQIHNFAKSNQIEWRDDSSNTDDHYQRNFLRHHVIPRLHEINPNLDKTFENTAERIAGATEMIDVFLTEFKSRSWKEVDNKISIQRKDLSKFNYPQVILWELLKPKGFNYDQCCDVIRTTQSGKQFYSATHCLTVDRDSLLISERKESEIPEVLIEHGQQRATNGLSVIYIAKKSTPAKIDKGASVAILDASKIVFPLRWRKWKNGDAFQPLGMSTHKKISDLLIDLKIPLPEKEDVTVLESAGKIVWVVGQRISDEFKITNETTDFISLTAAKLDAENIS